MAHMKLAERLVNLVERKEKEGIDDFTLCVRLCDLKEILNIPTKTSSIIKQVTKYELTPNQIKPETESPC